MALLLQFNVVVDTMHCIKEKLMRDEEEEIERELDNLLAMLMQLSG